jgi:hypothetical protein
VEVRAYDRLRHELQSGFPDLYGALTAVARSGGQLRTTRQERDVAAEERRVERSIEGLKLKRDYEVAVGKGPGVVKACNHRLQQWMKAQPPIMRAVVQEVGLLSGGRFLSDGRLLMHHVATAVAAMAKLSEEVTSNRSDHWNASHPFSKTFSAIRDAIALIDGAAIRVDEAKRFSSQANIERIVTWSHLEAATAQPRVRRAVIGRGRMLTDAESGVSWSVPTSAGFPALEKLDQVRRALGDRAPPTEVKHSEVT